jgi:serine/threonine-protein kinase
MRKLLAYTIAILIFFVIGLLLANFIIMPAIVHMGKEITVPNVGNIPLDSAMQILNNTGLQGVVVERRHDHIIEEGKIIIQEPLPDTRVKKGRIINLTVSLGTETITVPFLTGVDLAKGIQIIEKLGFAVSDIDSILSDSIPRGKIIRTIPEFETEMKKGEEIKIIISKGMILKMPNLVGMNINDAQAALKRMDLIIKEITEVEGSGAKGTIMVQNPEPEMVVNSGDSVSLMVIK